MQLPCDHSGDEERRPCKRLRLRINITSDQLEEEKRGFYKNACRTTADALNAVREQQKDGGFRSWAAANLCLLTFTFKEDAYRMLLGPDLAYCGENADCPLPRKAVNVDHWSPPVLFMDYGAWEFCHMSVSREERCLRSNPYFSIASRAKLEKLSKYWWLVSPSGTMTIQPEKSVSALSKYLNIFKVIRPQFNFRKLEDTEAQLLERLCDERLWDERQILHLVSKFTKLKRKKPTTKVLVGLAVEFIEDVQDCYRGTLEDRPNCRFELAPGNAEALLGILLIERELRWKQSKIWNRSSISESKETQIEA